MSKVRCHIRACKAGSIGQKYSAKYIFCGVLPHLTLYRHCRTPVSENYRDDKAPDTRSNARSQQFTVLGLVAQHNFPRILSTWPTHRISDRSLLISSLGIRLTRFALLVEDLRKTVLSGHDSLSVFQLTPLCVCPSCPQPPATSKNSQGSRIILGGQCGCVMVRGRLLLGKYWCLFTVLDATFQKQHILE